MASSGPAVLAFVVVGIGTLASCGYDGGAQGVATGEGLDGGTSGNDAGGRPDGGNGGDGGDGDAALGLDASAPFLRGSYAAPEGSVDLDAQGTLGWIHWGTNGQDPGAPTVKASAPDALPTYMVTGTSDVHSFESGQTTFHWSNGSTKMTGSDSYGNYAKGGSAMFQLVRRVGTSAEELVVYAGLYQTNATFVVTLGTEPTALSYTAMRGNAFNDYARFTLDYRASAPDTPLVITWSATSPATFNSNITLSAATVAPLP